MANVAHGMRHSDVGTALSKTEWEDTGSHIINNQVAGDLIYASSTSQLSRLGTGSVAYAILQTNSAGTAPEWTTSVKVATAITPDASDGATLGTAALEWSDLYMADGAVISLGDDDDVTITHIHNDGILITSDNYITFRDSALKIYSSADGQLDIDADTEVEIAATTVDINGSADISGTLTIGSAGSGSDVTFYSATSGDHMLWDASDEKLVIIGTDGANALEVTDGNVAITDNLDVDGTTNLDAVDIDGAVQLDNTFTIGANDQGYDVIFYGDAASANMTWDTSVDDLILNGAARMVIPDGQLVLASTAVGSTAAELNMLDGSGKSTSSITIADADAFIVIDGTVTKQIPASDLVTYIDSEGSAGSMSNFILEDDSGDEVTISNAKEVKFIGSGLTTNWTNTSNGTDADPYDLTFTVDAAQTGITSIYATDLIIGEDSQTAIDFGTINEIDFKADNAARLTLTASALYPVTDNEIDLGTASLEFKDAFFDGTVTADAFSGPLTGNASGSAATVTGASQSAITSVGTLTSIVVANDANIGSAGDADSMSISSAGVVNFTQEPTVVAKKIKTVGTENMWVPAAAMTPRDNAGCANITTVAAGSAGQPDFRVLDFSHSATEHAQFTVAMPKSWDGGNIYYYVYWIGIASTDEVRWSVQVLSINNDEEFAQAYGTAVALTDTSLNDVTKLAISPKSGAIACGGADNDLLCFQVSRIHDHADDDMAGDARLWGLLIEYTTDAANDG